MAEEKYIPGWRDPRKEMETYSRLAKLHPDKTTGDIVDMMLGKESKVCNCVGPQNGEPLCPCRMQGVVIRNGRWIQPERDLGPVGKPSRRGSNR